MQTAAAVIAFHWPAVLLTPAVAAVFLQARTASMNSRLVDLIICVCVCGQFAHLLPLIMLQVFFAGLPIHSIQHYM